MCGAKVNGFSQLFCGHFSIVNGFFFLLRNILCVILLLTRPSITVRYLEVKYYSSNFNIVCFTLFTFFQFCCIFFKFETLQSWILFVRSLQEGCNNAMQVYIV
jgi:hypothetical protein